MKKIIFFIITTFITTSIFADPAGNEEKFYVGIGYGTVKNNTDKVDDVTYTTTDDESTAIKIFAGYRISDKFALEGFYADLGEVEVGDSSIEASSFGVTTVSSLNVHEYVNLIAKIGIHRGKSKGSGTAVDGDDADIGLYYGLGADFNVYENFTLRTEYEIYKLKEGDASVWSLDAIGNF